MSRRVGHWRHGGARVEIHGQGHVRRRLGWNERSQGYREGCRSLGRVYGAVDCRIPSLHDVTCRRGEFSLLINDEIAAACVESRICGWILDDEKTISLNRHV